MNEHANHDVERKLIALTSQFLVESGLPKREIKLDASLQRHLGIDSLGRAELFRRIEQTFAISVPDRLLAEAETLNDIAQYLNKTGPRVGAIKPHEIVTSHGQGPSIDPSQAKNLLDVLLLYGEKSPDKAHIFFQTEEGKEEIITYGQLLNSSLRVAYALRAHGLKEGETVAIMQPTNPGFFYTFFGTLLAGGIPVPIYPPFRMHMLEEYAKTEALILRNAEVRILVTFEQAEKLSLLVKAFVPSLKVVTTVHELLRPQALTQIFNASPDNIGLIQYTSGSTSDPKGVVLTHKNLLANINAYGKAINPTPDDVAVSWLPLYHDLGLIGMWLGSLYYGVPLILMTPFSFLNHPERWLWAIHYHRGTLSGAPNFAYELCVRKIDPVKLEGLDLSSWRMAANGAEKVYPRTLEQFAKKFAHYGFNPHALLPVYGLAESTVGLAMPKLGSGFKVDYVSRKEFEEERFALSTPDKNGLAFVSAGKPLAGQHIRIVDDENKILPERHVGNLQFCGTSSMQGYYNNPRATQAVFHDGWIDSGDLAYQAENEIYITGRRKDLIIKAGRNLYPAEIEELVSGVTGIRQGCVVAFGITDAERGTEQLVVVAETHEKNKAARQEITEKINQVMASMLDIVPDHLVLALPRVIPKTSSGKLQRAATKNMYMKGRLGRKKLPAWLQVTKLSSKWFVQKCLSAITLVSKLIYTVYVMLLVTITVLPIYFIIRFASPALAVNISRLWARFILLAALCPMKVIGKENLTKVSPVIFAANHASYVDAIVMMALLPPNTRLVGKKELFDTPIFRTFVQKLNYLPVDRLDLSKGLEDTKQIESALKAGNSVLFFPEGTFGYAAGLRPFRLGAFKIAAETNTPVCPIALQGTRPILRDDEKLLRPSQITVTVCAPIAPKGAEWQDVTQLRQEVRAEIEKYCGEQSLDFIAAQPIAPKLPKNERT